MQQQLVRLMRALAPTAIVLSASGILFAAHAQDETRSLTFFNTHTKETETIVFKRDGKFDPEGMKQINHMMRDWRRDELTEMDPQLIDTIWEIYRDVGSKEPIHLVSGYRSKKTNESLRRRGGGQARKSQHILGKAADIHFPDVDVKRLRNSALVREVGGVGYYPKSGIPFVHVDTGRVRHWPRIPRQELALLFPDGSTKHIPSDGRPLTRRDGEIALAKLDRRIDDFIKKKGKVKLPPQMMMAGFTPPSLNWPKASNEVTGSVPAEKTPPPPAQRERTVTLPRPASEPKPVVVKAPAPEPRIAVAPLEEAEHPEELQYGLYSIVSLLGDADLMTDRHLAQFDAPGDDVDGYLLRDPEQVQPDARTFGHHYARNLTPVRFGSNDAALNPLRTASR